MRGSSWNVLRIDSEYYQVDVTWDDPVMADGSDSRLYDYFCVTTEEIKRDHIFDDEEQFPVCTANKDNYFVHEGLYLEKYSFDEYKRVFSEKQTDGEMFAIRFSSKEELDRAVSDLIEDDAIFDISYFSDKTVQYSVTEGMNVLYVDTD